MQVYKLALLSVWDYKKISLISYSKRRFSHLFLNQYSVKPRAIPIWSKKYIQFPVIASYHTRSGVFGYKPEVLTEFDEDGSGVCDNSAKSENSNLYRYIEAYRKYGHLKANVNPLETNSRYVPELDRSLYGVEETIYSIAGLLHGCSTKFLSLEEIEANLLDIYCGEISAEFTHLPSQEEREWFEEHFEKLRHVSLSEKEKVVLATDLLRSQAYDNFVGTKLQTVKRYGGEGAESILGFMRQSLKTLSQDGVDEVYLGMAHRGKSNVLACLMQFPLPILMRKMKGFSEFPPGTEYITGDVLSHLHNVVTLDVGGPKPLQVSILPCPSHLESANPVTCGIVRGRQRSLREGHYSSSVGSRSGDKVVGIVIHGDAAVGGQGVNQEMMAFSELPNFSTGGVIHMVTNNQIGYTTPACRTRSHLYTTDICKMCSVPALHVNGDNPEAVVKATDLAVRYQRKFRRDVFVDINCWRRWGHNELDNPRFTNPGMYSNIDARQSVPDLYVEKLIEENILNEEEKNSVVAGFTKSLSEALQTGDQFIPQLMHVQSLLWPGTSRAPNHIEVWDTGVDISLLKYLGAKSVQFPETFNIHSHLKKTHVESRLEKLRVGKGLDWATGEALAVASLLHQGYDVRISGQDVGRGTFSQRHFMLVDQKSDEMIIPLNHMEENQKGFLEVANSILSEEGVLGFEYGMSIESPACLCIWEAQFGDFFNGAQICFDAFISAGELKWLLQSGQVIIVPHGYDGAGPEHSSCHVERFLQLCDSREDQPDSERVNWNVINPTNSSQIFHSLRRQMIRNYRKPLIVVGPKAILRLPAAFSSLDEFAPGTHFLTVIGDKEIQEDKVKRVIFVSGKHYYALKAERAKLGISDTAIIRLESLCPFPTQEINEELAKYKKATKFVWAQEEHRNMGVWFFVHPRFRNLCGTELQYAGREVSGSPAAGIKTIHDEEVSAIMEKAFR